MSTDILQLPARTGSYASYLYVVEIHDIGVKVGITRDPRARIDSHRRDAEAYGRTIGRIWVSPEPQANARDNEKTLVGGSAREFLAESFDSAVARAIALPKVVETPEDRAATQEREEAVSKALSGITDRFTQQISAAGAIGDTLRYIMHRLNSTIGHLDSQEPDYIGDALAEFWNAMLAVAKKALSESGRSIDFYDDGSPVEIIFPSARPGVSISYIRRPEDPLEPQWILDLAAETGLIVVEGEVPA